MDERWDPAVRIIDSDPAWAEEAAREIARIESALGVLAARVEHVGSTSVPGLAAKPIVDLQVSVTALEPRERFVAPLEGLGYMFVPDPAMPDYHFFARPHTRPHTHHVHVCDAGSDQELRHLVLRDYLRAHPGEVEGYAALKREVAGRHPEDRLAYVAGKERYVLELEARALRWHRSR
jgi:GrpB-like predicted nucleotidyltransferase (UPF0157 family)